jgi:hypothetical protein
MNKLNIASGQVAATKLKEQFMKISNFLLTAAAGTLLGIVSATAEELQSVTVQYGQGNAVTFFKPVAPDKTAGHSRTIKQDTVKVRWVEQGIPNGSAISYTVPENPRYEIAPLK